MSTSAASSLPMRVGRVGRGTSLAQRPSPTDPSLNLGDRWITSSILGAIVSTLVVNSSGVRVWSDAVSTADGLFGNGIDGAHVVVGVETLVRDMFYTTLVVPAGTTLNTGGFRIYAKVSITVAGTIAGNGANGVGHAGGANPKGTLPGGAAGGDGAFGGAAAGSVGADANNCMLVPTGGNGGAGGADGAGHAGGLGGTRAADAALGSLNSTTFFQTNDFNIGAGAGGGGGGCDATGDAGGGGAGGMIVELNSPSITVSLGGKITANGGNGGNATAANAGGGGSGGAGVITMLYEQLVLGDIAPNLLKVNPGVPGAGSGTGLIGVAGAAGAIFHYPLT